MIMLNLKLLKPLCRCSNLNFKFFINFALKTTKRKGDSRKTNEDLSNASILFLPFNYHILEIFSKHGETKIILGVFGFDHSLQKINTGKKDKI